MQLTGQKPSEFDTATKNSLKAALGIASNPNVKRYKALLEPSFSGNMQDGLVAHALNADDPDYLGDLAFDYAYNGVYFVHGFPWPWPEMGSDDALLFFERKVLFNTQIGQNCDFICQLLNGELMISFRDANSAPYLLQEPFPFEIDVILRGDPLILLSARLPESGDRFILTFDRPISHYRLREALANGAIVGSYGSASFYDYTINGNDLELIIDPNTTAPFNPNSECRVDILANAMYIPNFYIEARDFGKVAPVSLFNVTNNMQP